MLPFNDIINPDELTSKLRTLLSNNNNMLNRDLPPDSEHMTMDGELEVEQAMPAFERDPDDLISEDNSAIEPVLEQIQYNRESGAPYVLRMESGS